MILGSQEEVLGVPRDLCLQTREGEKVPVPSGTVPERKLLQGVPFPSGTVPERKLPHNAWGMVGMSEGKLLQSVWRIGEGCTVCFRQGAGRNVAAKCLGHGGARPEGCTDTVPEQKLLQGILAW